MSELSRAISKLKVCNIPGNPELRKQIKDAFRAGWEAREELLNKRVAEIEKAATMKERERCAQLVSESYGWFKDGGDYHSKMADIVRSGK